MAEAIVAHLRKISGDASLTLQKIESGSVRLLIDCSPEALTRIAILFREGQLAEILNTPVQGLLPEIFEQLEALPYLIFAIVFTELRQSTRASEQNCKDIANRLTDEVIQICSRSQRIQESGETGTWAATLARHRIDKCLTYYQLGSRRGRIELHSYLGAVIYRHIPLPSSSTFQDRLAIIEDFLQGFYVETFNAFRRENRLPDNYIPRTMLDLAEYMAFTEAYSKRRISLPDQTNQQLIIIRVQSSVKKQLPESQAGTPQTVWEFIYDWLGADLQQNFGLTPQQWNYLQSRLSTKQLDLLRFKQEGMSDEMIAQNLDYAIYQVREEWVSLLEQVLEIRGILTPAA